LEPSRSPSRRRSRSWCRASVSSCFAGFDVIPEDSRSKGRRDGALAGFGLLFIGVGAFLASRLLEEPGRGSRLLADTEGSLELVVSHVNSARMSALRNAALVTEIRNALPPRAEMVLTVNDPRAFTVARNPWPDKIRFVELASDKSYTIWPQDPFLVLQNEEGAKEILISAEFERADDETFPETLARELGWPARRSSLAFEGGNIVSDEETTFIGANTVRYNALRLGETDVEIARRFEIELGKPVLVVGPYPQPVGHIDMILTPLGGKRIAVADAALGARTVRAEMEEHPEEVTTFEESCERDFFGDSSIRSVVDAEGKAVESPSIVGGTANAVSASESLAGLLDGVADALAARGYRVERIPFLMDEPPSSADGKTVGPGYPTLTYNNVLLDRGPEGATVFLPRYGLKVLDRRAEDAWIELGYRVVSVAGLTVSAMYGGSLRCCVKVLSR
jgi:hypothetical protein